MVDSWAVAGGSRSGQCKLQMIPSDGAVAEEKRALRAARTAVARWSKRGQKSVGFRSRRLLIRYYCFLALRVAER